MPLDPKKISDLQHPNTAPNKNLTLLETEEAGVSAHRTLTELLNQIDPRIISSLTQSGNVSGGDTLEVDQGGTSYKLDLTKLKDWLLVQFGQENKVSSRPPTVANILDSTLILTEDSGTETQRTALQMYQYILSKLPTPRIKDDVNGTTPLAGGHFIRTDDGSTQGKVTMGDVSTFVNSNLPEIDDLAPDTSPITDSVAVRIQRPSQTEKQSTALKLAEYMRIKNPVWHVPLLADGSSVTMDLHVAVSDGASGEVKHTLAEVFDAGEKRQVEVLKGKEQSLSPSSSFRVPLLLTQEQVTQLSDSSGKFQVGFGSAIATDGNVLAVGAYKDGSGVVYVYVRNGSVWNQQATLTAPSGQSFGYALSVYGGRILVGAPDEANQSGKVFLFGASGSTWSVLNTFTASDGASNDKFGCSVSLTASRAIVGALGSGKAYVFKETTGVWSEEYKTAAISGAFGTKVSAYGSRFVVGAPEDGALAVNAGAVYVFDHNGTAWAQTTKITVPGSAIGEKVGVALELGENLFASGGYKARAFVYELVSNAWVKRNDLISPNNDPLFGRHISLDGRSVWVSQASSSMSYLTKFEPSGQTWVVSNQVSHTFVGTTVSPIVGKGDYFFAGTEGDATNAGVVNQFNLTTTKTSVLTQTFGDYIEGKFHAKWGNRELPSSLASDEYKVVTQSAQGFYTIHGENLADRFLTYYKSQGEIGIPLIRNEQVGTTPLQDGHLIRVDTGTVQGKVTLQDLSNYMNYEINHPRIKDDPAGASPLQDGHFLRSDDGTTQGKITMLSLANFVKSKIPAALEIKDRVEDTTLTDTTFVLSQEGTDDQKRISLANVYGYIQSKWPATPQIRDRAEDTTPTDATLILTQEGTNPESKMTLANVYGYIQGKLPAPVVTMTGLTDTQLASLSTGQFLRYDATTSKWVNVNLTASDIPNLSTSKIVSGTLDVARVPDLDAGKITTGVFDAARIPVTVPVSNNTTNITNLTNQVSNLALPSLTDVTITSAASGNFLRHNGSGWVNVTLTEADIPSIGAAKITSGVLALARIPTIPQVTTNTSAIASLQTSLDGKTLVSLSDVAVANPNTGHILKWSAAASKWQNSAITGADIPNLDASKITTGTISINRIPTIPQVLTNQNDITTLQGSLTTLSNQVANLNFGGLTDVTLTSVAANQLVKYNSTTSKWENGVLAATDIPALPASKITSGSFNLDRIPNLPASKVTSGVFDLARIPTIPQVTTNTTNITALQSLGLGGLSDVTLTSVSLGQLVKYDGTKWVNFTFTASDVPNLPASKITSGTLTLSRIPSLPASKVNSGVLDLARIPTIPQVTTNTTNIASLQTSLSGLGLGGLNDVTITTISSGQLVKWDGTKWVNFTFSASDVPNIPASKITSGTLTVGRIPNLDAAKVTSGVFDPARIPSDPNVGTNTANISTLQANVSTLTGRMNVGGLDDTTITSATNNQYLRYDGSTQMWKNVTLVAGDVPNLPASKITSGILDANRLPNLDASKVTSGVFDLARIPTIPQVTANTNAIASIQTSSQSVTSLSDTEIATLANGHVLVYESATSKWKNRLLLASDVPNLDAAKITTGSLGVDRVPALPASKITSGVFSLSQIPALPAGVITSGVLGTARIPDLDASKITTGVLNLNRFPSIPNTLINGLGTMSTQNHTAVNIDGGDIAGISRLRVDSGSDTSELSILHSYSRGFAFNLTGNTNKLVSYSDATNATRTVFSTGRRGTAALPTNGVLGYDFNVGANTRLTIEDSVITATKSIRTMQPAGANVEVASFRRDADMFHFYIDGTTNHILSYSDPTNGKVLRLESRCTSNAVPTNNTLGIDFRVNSQEFMRMRLNENNVTISKDFNVVGASTNFNVTNAEVGLRRHAVLYNGAFIYMQPGKLGISQGSNWLRLNNSGHYTNGVYCANSIVRTDNQFQVNANGSTFRAHSSELRSNTGRLEFLVGGVSHFRIESGTNTIYTLPIDIKGNKLYFNTRNAIFDNGDGWLRLNQDNHFTNGVYTPYLIRSELRIIAGNEGTKFVRADQTRLTCNTTNQAILMSQTNSSNIVNGGGTTGQLELRSNTKTGGAYMASLIFHRPTAFACHLGIDESYNGLKVGGWSYGTNSYKVWTEHNLQWPVAWSSGSGRRIVFTGGAGNGLVFWGNTAYSIYMSPDADTTWGGSIDPTSDYNMYFKMHYNTRGWCFKQSAAPGGIAAQINGRGDFYNRGQLCSPSRSVSYSVNATHNVGVAERITFIYGAPTSSPIDITLNFNSLPNKSCGPIFVVVKTNANNQTNVSISGSISGIWSGSSPIQSWTLSPNPQNTLVLTIMYCENLSRYFVTGNAYYAT